jgi:hypothetical protein
VIVAQDKDLLPAYKTGTVLEAYTKWLVEKKKERKGGLPQMFHK